MSIAATTIWEVRSGGSATNGGGFDPAFGGTDYSQQTAAQLSLTDLASAGVSTTLTSVTGGFTAAMVGNIVHITSGTNLIANWFEIVAYTDTNTVTVDKTVGNSMVSGVGKVGGAVDLLSTIANVSVVVAGNIIYEQAGTFTSTTTQTITISGTSALPVKVVGYTSNRTPYNTDVKPVHTSATNSIVPITLNGCAHVWFYNFRNTHTAATRGNGWANATSASSNIRWINCECDGCLNGWASGVTAASWPLAKWENCVAKNSTAAGWTAGTVAVAWSLHGCWADSNATSGMVFSQAAHTLEFVSCAFTDNTNHGILISNTTTAITRLVILGCLFDNNGGDGFSTTMGTAGLFTVFHLENNIFYGNGVYGFNDTAAASDQNCWQRNNAYGANGTAARNNLSAGQGDIALSADPFTNRASDDYSLNNVGGGGAALRAAGFPAYIGSNTYQAASNYLDSGPAQAIATAGGASPFVNMDGGMI